jgi:hypothetical protein
MYKTVYTKVEVDVDLSDFDTDDLKEELESRGDLPPDTDIDVKDLVEIIWMRRRNGQNYDAPLDQLIYKVIGRVI